MGHIDPSALVERDHLAPNLPHAHPTESYWQNPPSDIADHRTTPHLPPSTAYIIIGSGLSGACIAHNLLYSHDGMSPAPSILMLEARQASSGATGRNGGHTKAASYRSFRDHERRYGTEEAVKIARLELANIRATHALAREYALECDSLPCDTVDVFYSEDDLARGREAVERMREVFGPDDPVARYEFLSAEETRARVLVPDSLGAVKYEAGSISAYRFTIGLLKRCLARGLNLQTATPAISISRQDTSSGEDPVWVVRTVRGHVTSRNVVVATNGYTAHLLPQMKGLIVPLRGQITAQRPGSGLPQEGLETTVSFIYDTGFDYMITRPSSASDAGTIVIGGGIGKLEGGMAVEIGRTDDDALNSDLTTYLAECTPRFYGNGWGKDHNEGRVTREWTGIMGYSPDGLPYVGQVPGMKGVWLSACFNGSGMVHCLKSAEAVVDMMGSGKAPDWFPEAMQISEKRLQVEGSK